MLDALHLIQFRGFEHLEIQKLGRINLFVGKNNTGKSSVLEAISAIGSGDPTRLFTPLLLRGERLREESEGPRRESSLDIRHLFHGRSLEIGTELRIRALTGKNSPTFLSARVVYFEGESGSGELFDDDGDNPIGPLALEIEWEGKVLNALPLSYQGGLRSMSRGLRSMSLRSISSTPIGRRAAGAAQFVTTDSLSSSEVAELWSEVALTDDEDRIVAALRVLEPDLERIAFVSPELRPMSWRSKEGIVVKLKDSSQRCPIGSMGDGMWRLLCLSLSAVRAQDGFLLVDEIDTGLHYSALSDMWRMLDATSRRLNIQIFATTHSYDCVQSLATICSDDSSVRIHRIESGASHSVAFTEPEIRAAAARNIEIR